MNNRTQIVSLMLCALLGAASAQQGQGNCPAGQGGQGQGQGHGQRQRPGAEQLMRDLDTNKDSKLSKDEARGPIVSAFQYLDTDGDGFLSLAEMQQGERNLPPQGAGGGQGGPGGQP